MPQTPAISTTRLTREARRHVLVTRPVTSLKWLVHASKHLKHTVVDAFRNFSIYPTSVGIGNFKVTHQSLLWQFQMLKLSCKIIEHHNRQGAPLYNIAFYKITPNQTTFSHRQLYSWYKRKKHVYTWGVVVYKTNRSSHCLPDKTNAYYVHYIWLCAL